MEKIVPNKLNEEQKFSLKTRVITALVLAAILLPCVFLGGYFYYGAIAALSILAAIELVKVSKMPKRPSRMLYVVTIIAVIALINYVFIRNIVVTVMNGEEITPFNLLYKHFGDIQISVMLIMLFAGLYFFISFINDQPTIIDACFFIAMTLVVALGFQSFLYLRYSPFAIFEAQGVDITTPVFKYAQSSFLLFYVVIGVFMNDMGAYFAGIFFGKHKINPRISPKKTWEGLVGGVIISAICSISWALFLDLGGYPIHPSLCLNKWYWVIAISLLMPLLGVIGDFVFSAIKRHFGVKDYSQIFPGHGGVLDRVDSLLFAAALVSGMIVFISFIGA